MKRSTLLLLLLALIGTPGCGGAGGTKSTKTSSTKFTTLSEKVAFLERYVAFRRTYKELEFLIAFQDNSGGLVPGPNDWDLRVAARVPASELAQWTQGLQPTTSPDVDWLKSLPGEIDHSGVAAWYDAGGRLVGVDEGQSIVVYRNRSR